MIKGFSFGRIVVGDATYTNDIKIIDGRVVADWWRRRGHTVDVEDVSDILAARPEVLVIGKGEPGFMKTSRALRQVLEKNGIRLIEEKTPRACKTFNRLWQEGRSVAAGFHVSC